MSGDRRIDRGQDKRVADRRRSRAAAGLTLAMLFAGGVNYAYTLGMGALLPVASFSVFASAQALLFVVGTMVSSAAPWFLAGQIASEPTEKPGDALVFAIGVNALVAVVACLIGALLIGPIGGTGAVTATLVAIVVVALGSTSVGLFMGRDEIVNLSVFRTIEASTRAVFGFGGVLIGFGAAAAIGATAVGTLVFLVPLVPLAIHLRWRVVPLMRWDWWRSLSGHAAIQVSIAVLAAADILLAAYAGLGPDETASYQLAASLSRIPFYLATAIAISAFSEWSRSERSLRVVDALRQYLIVAIPISALLASIPPELLELVYPDLSAQIDALLGIEALGALLLGGGAVLLVHLQATGRYGSAGGTAVVSLGLLFVGSRAGGSSGVRNIAFAFGLAAAVTFVGGLWLNRRQIFTRSNIRRLVPPAWVALSPLVLVIGETWVWLVVGVALAFMIGRAAFAEGWIGEVES